MKAPLPFWFMLVCIAVFGSLCFGATLPSVSRGAVWFTVSAGVAWMVFIPAVAKIFRVSMVESIHVALITMAVGEAVLLTSAAFNWLNHASDWRVFATEVAMSNIAMATAFAAQFQRRGVSLKRSLSAWMLGLNVVGGVAFLVLDFIL